MAAANPYPDYQNSGLNWVSRIPAHWETCKLKYAATFNPSRSESIGFRINDALVSFLPMKCVTTDGRLKNVEARNASEVWEGFTYFRRNDVVIAKITPCFENGKGGFLNTLPTEIGFGSTEFIVLRAVSRQTSPAFLAKLLSLKIFRALGADAMTGAAGQQRVPLSFVKNFRVVLPPCAEQDQIVAYLRVQDAHIARFIKAKRELIGLLHEQKLRIIDRAVTRGLDPTAKLKPSGIEWLGEVPEHWKVVHIGSAVQIVNGYPFESELFDPAIGHPLVRIRDLNRMYTEVQFNGPEVHEAVINTGDLIVGMDGDFNAARWRGGRALLNQRMCCLRPRKQISTEYLALVIPKALKFINDLTLSTTVKHLSSGDVRRLRFPVPGETEQLQIVAYVEAETAPINDAIARTKEEIKLIREYRDRLIFDAVTGQVDVRGWQPAPDDAINDDGLTALHDANDEPVKEEYVNGHIV